MCAVIGMLNSASVNQLCAVPPMRRHRAYSPLRSLGALRSYRTYRTILAVRA